MRYSPKAHHIQGHPLKVLYFVYQTIRVYYNDNMILHNDDIISAHQVYYIEYIYPRDDVIIILYNTYFLYIKL